MKKLLLLLLLFTGIAKAQPIINNPSPYHACDTDNDGVEIFYFQNLTYSILGSLLDPSLHTITYYTDSAYTNVINNSDPFSSGTATIYITVYENSNPSSLAYTTVSLVVFPYFTISLSDVSFCKGTQVTLTAQIANPENYGFYWYLDNESIEGNSQSIEATEAGTYTVYAYQPNSGCTKNASATVSYKVSLVANQVTNMIQSETSFDGVNTFNLASKTPAIVGAQTGYEINYFLTETDAHTFTNPIATPNAFANTTNPQTIYVGLLNNVTGCISETNFQLLVTNAIQVNIPNVNFKNALLNSPCIDTNFDNVGDAYVDTNNNDEIEPSEAQAVNRLVLAGLGISDLTGIESFTNLNHLDVNSNALTSINLSSLTNLVNLYCYTNFLPSLNLTGLSNLIELSCSGNLLTSLDLNSQSTINTLYCGSNRFKTLDLSNSISLNNIDCSNNLLKSLNVSNLTNLYFLYVDNNRLKTIDIQSLSNLTTFSCYQNSLTSLNVPNNLSYLNCGNNQINNLNFNNATNLQILNCDFNIGGSLNVDFLTNLSSLSCRYCGLFELNLSNNPNLGSLTIDNNQLTNLDLSNNLNLNQLYCQQNQFSNLNINFLTNLTDLGFGNNNLNSVDISGLINLAYLQYFGGLQNTLNTNSFQNLIYLFVENSNFSEIDVSSFPNLSSIQVYNNLYLTYINIKNGGQFSNVFGNSQISIYSNPSLQFVCTNEIDLSNVNLALGSGNNNANVQASTYCSFTPGGDYNTIAGTTTFDANNNGCDTADALHPNIRLNINDGTTTGATFTNEVGNYSFFTQAGSFDINPSVENSNWFTFSPVMATIPFANNNNNTTVQNFCVAPNGIHPDVEVVLTPITPARPGFDATYKLVYKNKGNQTQSGTVNLVFNDDKTDFVSSDPIVENLAINSLTWNYSNLLPFESRSIYIVLNVNSPLETPPVYINDILNFTATINPLSGDDLPDDNTFVYNQTVVGSFDPNDITCLEGETVAPSEIGKYLHYAVNFENTGTYYAENVVVKDIIDTTKYDINSLQVLNTSHDSYIRITGNVVEFIFENINLQAAQGNPPVGGHGNVLFKIKSKNDLVSGDSVSKSASIFFDYNAPISTNIEQTTFMSLSNSIFEFDNSVSIYPNPTSSKININSNFNIKSIELYDVQGRVLVTQIGSSKSIDISDKTIGIYFVKITTEKGSKVEKIVKK